MFGCKKDKLRIKELEAEVQSLKDEMGWRQILIDQHRNLTIQDIVEGASFRSISEVQHRHIVKVGPDKFVIMNNDPSGGSLFPVKSFNEQYPQGATSEETLKYMQDSFYFRKSDLDLPKRNEA